jgi:hypothetical protein
MRDGTGDDAARVRWLRDLRRFLPLKSQFVLSGNVRDYHLLRHAPGAVVPAPLVAVLDSELRSAGYAHTLTYDLARGFRVATPDPKAAAAGEAAMRRIGLAPAGGCAPAGLDLLGEVVERLVALQGEPVALVVDFASRLVARHDDLRETEQRLFARAFIASHATQSRPCGPRMQPFFNTVLWIVEKEGDLPDWLLIGNPRIRTIPLARPDHNVRRAIAGTLLASMPGASSAAAAELAAAERSFIDETEGLLLVDMMAVTELGRAEGVEISRIGDAVRRYKVGVTDDPWRKLDRDRIRRGDALIRARVRGQDHAVTHMLDIVKRAIAGVGAGRRGGRPRGVAFLAGPTGVGKTELAKAVTELLFGDESAYIRFDMSEFSAEHADQRLIGAPPGYIGYDAGGELTNAIREKPFSVVLFDEIEKAHPRILDKFLQVLDDGVLTSGRGDRVYFSEAFIVFTSNLGIYKLSDSGRPIANVTPDDALPEVQRKVSGEIERYFNHVLNRPEILNRLGKNIIVFDWIRSPVASQILDQMIAATLDGVAEQGIAVEISGAARATLAETCLADLSNGGRGIRNQIEAQLVNPLARALFDADARAGSRYTIAAVAPGQISAVKLVPRSRSAP